MQPVHSLKYTSLVPIKYQETHFPFNILWITIIYFIVQTIAKSIVGKTTSVYSSQWKNLSCMIRTYKWFLAFESGNICVVYRSALNYLFDVHHSFEDDTTAKNLYSATHRWIPQIIVPVNFRTINTNQVVSLKSSFVFV